MQNKKILIAGNSFWTFKNFRLNLIKEITKKNKTFILSTGSKKDLSIYKLKNCKLIDVKYNPLNTSLLEEIKVFFRFYKYCKKIKPNIIFVFHMKPIIYLGIISKLLNIKIINTIAGSGRIFNKNTIFNSILKYVFKNVINKSYINFFQNK